MPFKLSRKPQHPSARQPSARSLARLDKFMKPQAPAAPAHKTTKPGIKHTVKAFFQNLFKSPGTPPRVRDAQQCVVRTVVTDLPPRDLAKNSEYRESLLTLAQPPVLTTANSLPFSAEAYAAALVNPLVTESAPVPPEPASTHAPLDASDAAALLRLA